MRGTLETIVGAMFAGKTSEILKRILWAEHQGKSIIVIKPQIDNRYSKELISTHNNLSHECYSMSNWDEIVNKINITKEGCNTLFLDEVQFMDAKETINHVEQYLMHHTYIQKYYLDTTILQNCYLCCFYYIL